MSSEKIRATGLYVLGFAILAHQAFLAPELSETLLLVAMALVGLPSTLIADRILTRPSVVNPPVAGPSTAISDGPTDDEPSA